MTGKVQKILNEIMVRKLCTMDEHMAFYSDKAKEDYRFLSEIEEVVKALQEEPVSENLEEAIDTYLKSYWGGEKEKQEWPFLKKMAIYFAEWQKQKDSIPVSEELEKAAEEYIEYTPRYDIGYELEEGNDPTEIECFTIDETTAAFIEGAKWQKEQIIKRLCNHAKIDQMVEKFEYKYKPENVLDTEYYKRGIFDTIKAIKEG